MCESQEVKSRLLRKSAKTKVLDGCNPESFIKKVETNSKTTTKQRLFTPIKKYNMCYKDNTQKFSNAKQNSKTNSKTNSKITQKSQQNKVLPDNSFDSVYFGFGIGF